MIFLLIAAVTTAGGNIRYTFEAVGDTDPDNRFDLYHPDLRSDGEPVIVGYLYELALHHLGAPE